MHNTQYEGRHNLTYLSFIGMLRPKHQDGTSYIFRYWNCHSLHTVHG